ncbi:MAG: bifunctional 4-hydroxy-2-oxoglutarate aldolase/2-dehydro-3-deoxy-phosphogluconate aldolase [Cyanobacteriota bacterium]|nr:bifunctional 4-hydroxy-2-oxoglutarate aldolase/2-dehydro-3-deoxy-phosphogluconate aldolase [Cyanobacteriota bacterium]
MPPAPPLITGLRAQPLLVVLRPGQPRLASQALERLLDLGLRHVEIAWQPLPCWVEQMADLVVRFPQVALGAASVCLPQALKDAAEAGCRYAVSPVLDPELLRQASDLDLHLVPGVLTATEVHRARQLGCSVVKLFPAVSVGPAHWRRMLQPLGDPLPFCIAAGGLTPADVLPWLAAGVDAIALGSGLGGLNDHGPWTQLLAALPRS